MHDGVKQQIVKVGGAQSSRRDLNDEDKLNTM